ncbi:hypothetical protein [Methylobacterium pseudosasicola]|uniref:Integrase catalytic domain-containing protein n=1 Tax=Methylobacterium pseudosasicola TaxID=582667 RepID=A0A1I4PUG8_9HYPH|nr:hypothetical protein [Methylobacterium pseudosasicola]SFM31130.1 hypothetical protein SAMN05192568_102658 [Methylobacterium pseudosasicola]
MPAERYKFGHNDRITIDGVHYRPSGRQGQANLLRLVIDNALVDTSIRPLTDSEYVRLHSDKKIRIEEGYYSHAFQLLRDRAAGTDLSDLSDLDDEQLRTVAWKVEWCVRFNQARIGAAGYMERPNKTPEGLAAFIASERELIHRWYIGTFDASRPPGRKRAGFPRKSYDYPGATTLLEWLDLFERGDGQPGVFRPQYANCGNRRQLDPRALAIVEGEVRKFASGNRIKPTDVFTRVEAELMLLNRRLPPECHVSVGASAIRRRIRKLPTILIDLAHLGPKKAELKYNPVGKGMVTLDGLTKLGRMERVEMDDWEFDLFAILKHRHVRPGVTPQARAAARVLQKNRVSVRCTVTVAIDVATKCIVGLHVTPFPPSAAGSKSALQSIVVDKNPVAKLARCTSEWPMMARPSEVATDEGPAFQGDFRTALGKLQVEHRLPGKDPRTRGTIESFFRTFKRFCRIYTGQSFSNVVERGEYQSEDMASILMEDVYMRLVRFIVDEYHHKTHEGLGGERPYKAWQFNRADNRHWPELNPAPDADKRLLAFGLAVPNRVVGVDGVTYLNAVYTHDLMGKMRGYLGERRITIVTDPCDMGAILVRVPPDLRHLFPCEAAYLRFDAPDLEGIGLADWLKNNRDMRRYEKQEKLAGNPFRLTAHLDLMRDAEEARKRAGVPSHVVSEAQLNALVKLVERGGALRRAEKAAPSGRPIGSDVGSGSIGVSLAKPARARRPARGTSLGTTATSDDSINMYGEDDE